MAKETEQNPELGTVKETDQTPNKIKKTDVSIVKRQKRQKETEQFLDDLITKIIESFEETDRSEEQEANKKDLIKELNKPSEIFKRIKDVNIAQYLDGNRSINNQTSEENILNDSPILSEKVEDCVEDVIEHIIKKEKTEERKSGESIQKINAAKNKIEIGHVDTDGHFSGKIILKEIWIVQKIEQLVKNLIKEVLDSFDNNCLELANDQSIEKLELPMKLLDKTNQQNLSKTVQEPSDEIKDRLKNPHSSITSLYCSVETDTTTGYLENNCHKQAHTAIDLELADILKCDLEQQNKFSDFFQQPNMSTDCLQQINRTTDCLQQSNVSKDCLQQSNVSKDCLQQSNISKDCLHQSNISKDCLQQSILKELLLRPNVSKDCLQQSNMSKDCLQQLVLKELLLQPNGLKDCSVQPYLQKTNQFSNCIQQGNTQTGFLEQTSMSAKPLQQSKTASALPNFLEHASTLEHHFTHDIGFDDYSKETIETAYQVLEHQSNITSKTRRAALLIKTVDEGSRQSNTQVMNNMNILGEIQNMIEIVDGVGDLNEYLQMDILKVFLEQRELKRISAYVYEHLSTLVFCRSKKFIKDVGLDVFKSGMSILSAIQHVKFKMSELLRDIFLVQRNFLLHSLKFSSIPYELFIGDSRCTWLMNMVKASVIGICGDIFGIEELDDIHENILLDCKNIVRRVEVFNELVLQIDHIPHTEMDDDDE